MSWESCHRCRCRRSTCISPGTPRSSFPSRTTSSRSILPEPSVSDSPGRMERCRSSAMYNNRAIASPLTRTVLASVSPPTNASPKVYENSWFIHLVGRIISNSYTSYHINILIINTFSFGSIMILSPLMNHRSL